MPHALANGGAIEAITGPMFSGKTEELLRRLKRYRIARIPTLLVKPARDTRTDAIVKSRGGSTSDAVIIHEPEELLILAQDFKVIGVDEVQFEGKTFPGVARQLARQGKHLILAFLDLDFRGEPFEVSRDVLILCSPVDKMVAVCMQCSRMNATMSQRLTDCKDRIMVGDSEYEARCLSCFEWPRAS